MNNGETSNKANTNVKSFIFRTTYSNYREYDFPVKEAKSESSIYDDVDLINDVFEGDIENTWNIDYVCM